ncbi:Fe-S cluster assembly protein SufD [Thermosporothrix hazakensis]|jgi:Fe-S cluster assembly protein SufD|uniref:Fe-S cluster assembly protein SufD n=1 Tax=Thermosporothrix hazakensis TaxID=644383 RepID=A0A326UCH2_THEHA|nr:Fe-S cluster assembly protein SufD [Thermosporothrix hazakensis]PZW22989.1 Fe-S cluster assembly protein SufD [Thermosporothrix hazakensis]GCE48301.1 Fe-S cluster assembly protein SufB [Thermosporothrix hazakensis]
MLNVSTTGFTKDALVELSRQRGEPEWLLDKRLQAWELYEQTPAPLGRRGDLGTLKALAGFRFQQLTSYVPDPSEKLPAKIEQSLQEALVNDRSGLIVQHNSSVVHTQLDEDLKEQGVILLPLDKAVQQYPELVQKYFMTECIPANASKYTALHAAFWTTGFFLYVPKGVEIEKPILSQVWIDAPSSATFTHTLVVTEPQSSVRFVEELSSSVTSDQPSLVSDAVEIFAQRESRVEFSYLQDLDQNTWNITNKNAVFENDGSVTFVMSDLGAKLNLVEIGAGLQGNGSAAELVGIFFTDHDQRYKINTLSDHVGLSTNAETLVKGVLTDESRVEFDGMIRVRPNAQQTASFLSAHGMMLSKKARGEFIPGLEIAANEVSASHGATTGQIDEEELFYLMSRGVPRPEAERIIVQGFFEPVLQRIPLENLRIRLRRSIISRMSGAYETEADTWVDAQERWEIEGVDEGAVHLDDSTRDKDEIELSEY